MNKAFMKLICLVIMLPLIIISAAGCNSGDKKSKDDLNALGAVNTKDLKETTLTFCIPGTESANAKAVYEEIKKRAYSQLKIKLKFIYVNDYNSVNYTSEISNNLSVSKEFDAFYLKNYGDNADFSFSEFAKQGHLKDISRLLPKYAPNIYGMLTPEQLKAASYGGRLYAIPNLFPNATALYAVVREDLVKKYNMPEIKTIEDYENYLKTIKENEKGFTTPGMIDAWSDSLRLFANACDYSILDKKLQLVYKRSDPKMKIEAWEQTPEFGKISSRLIGWKNKGYMEWGAQTDSIYDKLTSGYTASILALGSYFGLDLGKGLKAYRLYPDIKAERNPPIPGGISFNPSSKNVVRALMFMNWVESSQENYDLFMYGLKGIDYTIDKQKHLHPKSDYFQWQGSEAFFNTKYERNLPKNINKEYMDNTVYPQTIGFYADFSDLTGGSDRSFFLPMMEQNIKDGFSIKENIDQDVIKSYTEGTLSTIKELQAELNKWKSGEK